MGMPAVRTDARRPALTADRFSRQFDPTEVDGTHHSVEREVQRVLTSQPGLTVSNLVVRRIRDGVCLTGVIESMADDTDVCGLVRRTAGVNEVINRLLVRSAAGE